MGSGSSGNDICEESSSSGGGLALVLVLVLARTLSPESAVRLWA